VIPENPPFGGGASECFAMPGIVVSNPHKINPLIFTAKRISPPAANYMLKTGKTK
jgi:hypothetical protein